MTPMLLFRPKPKIASREVISLVESLRTALATLPFGVITRSFLPQQAVGGYGEPALAVTVQLAGGRESTDILLPFAEGGQGLVTDNTPRGVLRREKRNLNVRDHRLVLEALSSQALVRHVELPPMIEAAPAGRASVNACPPLRKPSPRGNYPVVGIIDGGVADIAELTPWRVGDAGLVPVADRDETHGTFITGLVVAGSALNPDISDALEGQGCKSYDLDIFPRPELRNAYYGQDSDYFFDMLDEKIKAAKRDHNVGIFNFSFGIRGSRDVPGTLHGPTVLTGSHVQMTSSWSFRPAT
jgi:hypothetical protein